jgi:hypothetical protein
VHDGALEWISDGTTPIARLGRPPAADGCGSYSIEFVLPSSATEAAAIQAAQRTFVALERWRSAAAERSRTEDPRAMVIPQSIGESARQPARRTPLASPTGETALDPWPPAA